MLKKDFLQIWHDSDVIIQQISRASYYDQNTFIVQDIKRNIQVIIDPGDVNSQTESLMVDNKRPVDAILLTHGHFDHLGAAGYLSNKFKADCFVHHDDKKLVKQSPNYALMFEKKHIHVPKRLTFLSDYNNDAVEIIHTPGHTNGSCCFKFANNLFTGDTLLFEQYGRTDLPGGNKEKLKKSIKIIRQICHAETLIFPGHGKSFKYKEIKE